MESVTPSTAFQPYLKILPWSRRGSFLSLSRTARLAPPLNLAPQTDLYLASQCVALSVPMFALRPLPGGLELNEPPGFHDSPSPTIFQATVSSIQWSYETFDSDVRSDPSVYMGMYVFERPPQDGLKAGVEVTYKTFPGYRFLPTKGYLIIVSGQTNAFRWELIVHELDTSMVRAEHKFTKKAILMSKLWMNKVWSWDHCFNALAIASLDQQLGLDQLTVVFDHQAPDGRLPDSIVWQDVEWGFTKPPIQGWALSRLLAQFPDMSDAKLEPLYDATARLTDF
ncbi:hypothetical protein Landi51_01149 [Colletotrichum acutatum]